MVPSVRYGNVPGTGKPVSRLVQGTVMILSKEAERGFGLLDGARALAENRGFGVPQGVLACVLGPPLDVFALVGCNTEEEFADNARAAEVSLASEERRWLRSGDGTGEGAAWFA